MTDPRVVPLHRPDRWRPTRAGLIGLWRYAEETFAFHNGRLLLRGPNGSGKSMALELLLPFLLDGDSSPNRLTSSGRSRGRLLDRLLAGSQESSRVGFAWVEFARGGEIFTAGARIRGSRATNKTDIDLFSTTQAVGRDLHLLDGSRAPLSRAALVEALGERGRVHGSADEHRAAVREALYPGFGAERYASVITALLALRREKLSDRLDPDKLSDVLSDALPPLDDHDIAAVAEGFERLDRRRSELIALERDVEQMRQLRRNQRGYARTVVLGSAARVRSAETVRDDVTRAERRAHDQLTAAEQRGTEVTDAIEVLQARDTEITVQLDALKDSDAYRAGAGLSELREQARRYAELAQRAIVEARERERRRDRAEQDADVARFEHKAAEGNAELATHELTERADLVGAGPVVVQARDEAQPDRATSLVQAWIGVRRGLLAEVRKALGTHENAVRRRDLLDEQEAERERDFAGREQQLTAAQAAEHAARDAYAQAVEHWVLQSETVGTQRLRAVVPAPAREPADVVAVAAALTTELAQTDAAARERLAHECAAVEEQRAALIAERVRWASDITVEPPGPDWRSDRGARSGAPFWRLVDIAPGVGEQSIDGLEAALTGAGLLDAWVAPDGRLQLADGDADVQLTARPLVGRTARDLLGPAAGSALPETVLTAVLSSLAVADTAIDPDGSPDAVESDVVLGLDGTYRLGAAVGRGPIRPAMLLGAAARERRRLARLAEIDAELADVGRRLALLDRELALLDQRRAAVEAELAAVPSPRPVADAVRLVDDAASRLDEVRGALSRARDERRAADETVRAALRELSTLATRHALPAEADALARVDHELDALRDCVQVWARRRRELLGTARAAQRAGDLADQARQDVDLAADALREAQEVAAEAAERLRTLESSVGTDYREIIVRIDDLGAERRKAKRSLDELRQEDHRLAGRLGGLRTDLAAAEQHRAAAEAEREISHREFMTALAALGADAGLDRDEPPESATAVLAAARALGAAHERADVSARALENYSQRVNDQVHLAQAALGARVDIDRELVDDGWWVLRATLNGLRRAVGEATEALAGQLEQGRAELAADEERLFEQTLAGSVRRALADRIRQANALVDAINVQLRAVKTAAAGVGVQLRWEVGADQPPTVRSARALLLRDPAGLSDQERRALQEFVRARVDQARAELEANAPWEARLRESLDYRSWHRFGLQLAHRDWEGYQPATSTRLQRLSTGERSMALHLPMIAAVAAHYESDGTGPSTCPRLILLDELFVGVDVPNRAQLFGAFSTWRLDAVFTSDHEWCQYKDLDGIAIHYLHPAGGDEPVTSTRFTWDGTRRVIDPGAA